MPTALKTIITSVKATDKASVINEKVNEAIAVYEQYTKLAAYKKAAIDQISAFYGYEYDGNNAKATSYSEDTQKQIANLQQLYSNYINIASTTDAIDSYVDAYYEKVDTYKTNKEQKIADDYDDVVAAIDLLVENTTGTKALNADQKTLLDRVISDLKADLKAGNGFPFAWRSDNPDANKATWVGENLQVLDINGSSTKLADVVYYIVIGISGKAYKFQS